MKITKLTLKDFRCHDELELDLGRFNFIFGANHAGKSSIEMAIEFLLTGRCSKTDTAGRGSEDLIRLGAKGLDASAEIDTGLAAAWRVERLKSPRGHELRLQGAGMLPLPEAQKLLCQRIGASAEVIGAVLHAGRLWELPPGEQKWLLASVLVAEDIPVPEEIRNAMEAVKYEVVSAVKPGEIPALYKMAYEDRTGVNRALRELGNLEEPELPANIPAEARVKQDLAVARAEVSRLVREREQLLAKHNHAADERERLTEALRIQERNVLPEAEVKRLENLLEDLPELRVVANTLATLEPRMADKERLRDELQGLVKKMACPTCHRTITKKDLDEILKPILEDITAIGKQVVLLRKESVDLAEAETADAQLVADRKSAFEIGNLKAQLGKLPPIGELSDTSAIAASIAELNARIPKGEKLLVHVSGIMKARRAWEESVAKKANLEAELAALETLIAFFGPDGAQKKATGDKLGPFLGRVNVALRKFGYQAEIKMEPFEITCRDLAAQRELKVSQLAESERLHFSVAFQAALAMVVGLRMIVVDRADMLDAENRRALAGMLLGSELDQVIVLSTGEMPKSAPAGVTFIELCVKQAAAA